MSETTNRIPSKHGKARGLVVLVVFGLIAAWLAFDVFRSSRQRAEVQRNADRLKRKVGELIETDNLVRKARQQIGKDKLFVWDMLRQCRVVEDIPVLPTQHVVTRHKGDEGFAICLPAGKHRLELAAEWKVEKGQPENASDRLSGKKTWSLDLEGESAYLLEVESDRKGGPVRWTITGNREAFQSRSEVIPIDPFHASSWSYSGDDVAVFPNQIQRVMKISDLEKAASDPPPIDIYDVQLGGKVNGDSLTIFLKGRLYSDGAASVDSSTAQSIIARQRADLLMPYAGNGKFELMSANPK